MASKKVTISLVTLLLISAAGNLFFAGLVAGRALHPDKRIERMMERDKELRAEVPDADRKTMRKMMREKLPEFKKAKSSMDQARRKVHKAISADPLDEAALRSALDELMDVQNQMQKAMAESVLEAAPQLSPEGRKAMVQHILFREGQSGRDRDAMRDRNRDQYRDKIRDRIRQRMMEERQGGQGFDGQGFDGGPKGGPHARARAFGGPDAPDMPPPPPPGMEGDYPPPPPPGMEGEMPPPPPPGMEPGMEGTYPPPPPPGMEPDMDVDETRPLMPPQEMPPQQ